MNAPPERDSEMHVLYPASSVRRDFYFVDNDDDDAIRSVAYMRISVACASQR